MALFPVKIPWTKAPPYAVKINRKNKFGSRISIFVILDERNGYRDLVSGKFGTVVGGSPAVNSLGPCWQSAYTGTYIVFDNMKSNYTANEYQNLTVMASGVFTNTSNTAAICGFNKLNITCGWILKSEQYNNKNTVGCTIPTKVDSDSGIATPAGLSTIGVSMRGSSDWRYLVNNTFSSATAFNTPTSNIADTFVIGAYAKNAGSTYADFLPVGDQVNYVAVFDTWGMSDAEMLEFKNNPWQVLEPRTVWVEVAAGGVTGTVAVTLDGTVSAITGTSTIIGAAAPSLENFSSSISGVTTVLGSLSYTLEDNSSTIAGSVGGVEGALNSTLDNHTSTITGTTSIAGTLSALLGNFSSIISGTTTVRGAMAVTLGDSIAYLSGYVGSAARRIATRIWLGLGLGL